MQAADPCFSSISLMFTGHVAEYIPNYQNLYVINPHNGNKGKGIPRVDINEYPAIKEHLDIYYEKLEKRYDKGETPYNLRTI